MRIAVFCPNWVGDLVMATPALRAIRMQYPLADITAVLRPYVAGVLEGLDLVDRLMLHDPFGSEPESRGWKFARKLRAEEFDWALVLPNSLRSAWWAWLSGASRRVGIARDGRGWLLTETLPARSRREPHPCLDEYLRVAQRVGCQTLTRQTELATTEADEAQLDQFWKTQGASPHEPVICLNPGGAFGTAKHWPVASFADLASRIVRELGYRVLVLCGPAEREEAQAIAHQANHPHIYSLAAETPSLGLTKAAIRRASLLVTTDSGPRHFAQPFRVPVVTLFGPTHQAWSETFYDRSIHVQLDLECGPCQQRTCPLLHHNCMQQLPAERVFRAVQSLIEKSSPLPISA
jgi:heptosyltransferase-2